MLLMPLTRQTGHKPVVPVADGGPAASQAPSPTARFSAADSAQFGRPTPSPSLSTDRADIIVYNSQPPLIPFIGRELFSEYKSVDYFTGESLLLVVLRDTSASWGSFVFLLTAINDSQPSTVEPLIRDPPR